MPKDVALIPGATSTLRRRIYTKIIRGKRNECWRWSGKTVRKRGGVRAAIQVGGRGSRTISVTRLLLVLRDRVPLPERESDGLEGGHRCAHYWCVNQRHLCWQTRGENEAAKAEYDAFEDFSEAIDTVIAQVAFEAEHGEESRNLSLRPSASSPV